MIGNEVDARFIRDWYREMTGNAYSDAPRRTPEGWEYVSSGCYRSVYLHVKSGVVYKIEREPGYSGGQTNRGEFNNLRQFRFKRLPKGCRFPRWMFFDFGDGDDIIAMEYFTHLLNRYSRYNEQGFKHWENLRKIQNVLRGLWDLHGANLAVDQTTEELVPIDLGG